MAWKILKVFSDHIHLLHLPWGDKQHGQREKKLLIIWVMKTGRQMTCCKPYTGLLEPMYEKFSGLWAVSNVYSTAESDLQVSILQSQQLKLLFLWRLSANPKGNSYHFTYRKKR